MFSRILSFLDHIFLLPREEVVFDELFEDRNEHYKAAIADWSLDATMIALSYTPALAPQIQDFKYRSLRSR